MHRAIYNILLPRTGWHLIPFPPPQRVYERTLRHNQIFSDGWFTKFYYPWCSAGALRAPELRYNTRSADILQDLRWDTLGQRRSKKLAISVFKSLNNLYPESLKNVFKPTSGVHSYNVRGASNNIFVLRPCTEAAKWAFRYRGAVMWNGLENVLKDEINLNSFKSALSLSWTRDCLEGVEIEFILVI